jgi:hypothetical protein
VRTILNKIQVLPELYCSGADPGIFLGGGGLPLNLAFKGRCLRLLLILVIIEEFHFQNDFYRILTNILLKEGG